MKFNWFYLLIATLFAVMLLVSFRYFRGSGHSTVGITYAKEHKINAEKSATIERIMVVPGQQVKAGELLVELTSTELEMEIEKLNNRIATLKSEKVEKSKLADSEIAYIKAQQGIDIEEINTDIAQAESELSLNSKLTAEFSNNKTTSDTSNPIRNKINSLKLQRTRHEQAIAIKVKDVLQESATEQQILENQIKLLDRELELLLEERTKLKKYAAADGVVESVFVKQGEQVDAYTALLSVNPTHPSTVVGYLIGKKEQLPVGTEVTVKSIEYRKLVISGKVIGYGSVVPLPEILQKSTAVKAFGQEIFIEIAPENGFANGEKVLIR